MEISNEFKQAIRAAMLKAKENFGGTETQFAKSLNINNSVYSRIKGGAVEGMLSDGQWITLGRKFQVNTTKSKWKYVETEIYRQLEDNFHFCQRTQTSMILVDDCGIGKTECAKIIVSKMKNAFFIDCSQSHTKIRLIKQIAQTLGCDTTGKYYEILENVKYCINLLETPFFCIDEAGDPEYNAYLELKGIMNATKGNASWYMMGADGLKNKINRGISNQKVGFAELLSRFSDDYVTLVPAGKDDKQKFYLRLFEDVASANLIDKTQSASIAKQCLTKLNENGKVKSLRYLETLVKVANEDHISPAGTL
ncbi:MAG: hypothetical protein E2590_12645 [Chryseobacterium sp.]|nr:hypothetical protein [Chryseobacterium sp.]